MRKLVANLWKTPFVRDVVTMQIGQVIPTLCGMLSSILFPAILGLGGYGEYAVVLAFTGVLGFVTNLGQQNTTLTFLAEAQGRGDMAARREVTRYYAIMSVGTVILLAIAFPFLPFLADYLYHKPEIGRLAQLVFAASMLDPLYGFLAIDLQVLRRIRQLTLIENVYTVSQLAFSVLFVLNGWGVSGILWGSLLTSMLSVPVSIVLLIQLRHERKTENVITVATTQSGFWNYASQGLWIAVDKSIGNLYPNIFLFILSLRSSEAVVGLVRIAFKFASLPLSFVLSNISRLAMTVIPTLSGRGRAVLGKNLLRLARYAVWIHFLASLGAAIAVPLFFPLVYKKEFGVAMYPFFVILAIQLTQAFHAIITPVLRLYKRIYWATALNSVALVLAIGLFFFLADQTRTTVALYAALVLYHGISLLIVFPTLKLFQQDAAVPVPA